MKSNRQLFASPEDRAGFTLVELMVVIGLIGALWFLLLPTLSHTRQGGQVVQCLNNNRQLCAAWRMYADDNRDLLVYSSDDGSTVGNPLNRYAWTAAHLDFNPSNRGNWDITYDITKRPLWPYCGENAQLYRCPSDTSYVTVNGTPKQRVRTMSMNLYLGGFAGTSGGIPSVQSYRIYTKLTQIPGVAGISPGNIFVFIEMRPDSISWGNFFTDLTGYYPNNPAQFTFQGDYPGYFHHLASAVSFCDGRVELHRWLDSRTIPPPTGLSLAGQSAASPRNVDIAWLQDHSTRPK